MTSQLSDAFYGNKKLTQEIYNQILSDPSKCLTSQIVQKTFAPHTTKMISVRSLTGDIALFDIFEQFIQSVSKRFIKWQFQKYSSIMQISAHVFEHSFEQWLTKQQSYRYFSEVIVRHSLFRPPHSVCVFQYNQMKEAIEFWVEHFLRFYEEYEQAFKSELNEKINCVAFPSRIGNFFFKKDKQHNLSKGKVVGKQLIANFL